MTLPPGVRVAWGEVADAASRRAVSRALLSALLPEATFVSRCPRCGGDHGRIRVSGADAVVSVSYAQGWAVGAVAQGWTRVGIDVSPTDAGGLDLVLPGADARSWTRVEAVLKVDGRGLDVDPARVEVASGADDAWTARIDDGAWVTGHDLASPPGLVAALAVAAE